MRSIAGSPHVKTLCIVFGTLVLNACFLLPKEEETLAPPVLLEPSERIYATADVRRGDIELRITGTAKFESSRVEDQYFVHRSGRIRKVFVDVGDVVTTGEAIADLYTGSLEDQIQLQLLTVEKIQLQIDGMRVSGSTRLEIEIAELDRKKEEIRLQMLTREMESSVLRASMDGKVVYLNRAFKPGATVGEFQTLMRIADPDVLVLKYTGSRIYDFEQDALLEVTTGEFTFEGRVVESPAGMPADAEESQLRSVTIAVPNLPPEIESGDIADISLVLDSKKQVLIVPRDVIREYMGRRYVYVLAKDSHQERTVETGIETETEVEIVKGLVEGELVIVR